MHLQLSPVRFDELAEGVAVARPGAGEHGIGHVATSSSPSFVAITRVDTGGRLNGPVGRARRL